ncbi:hypothetical protein GCM10022409_26070 [Hymenobacter glaciei]|uniref:Uncharacterized protein n=2 Tax=Hymenobacter glaciei TaxID=877209 RepID=A0ABP7UAQ6_9BACT
MLKQKVQLGIAAVMLGFTCTLSGCSKESNALPEPAAKVSNAGIQLVNGRLVFADIKSFQKAEEALWRKNGHELELWEKALYFQSLRAAPVTLDETSTPGLMMEFGFPMQYAALINPKGEYQIGDKIYWFHQGFKYEASSEEELQRIKNDPSIAKNKYQAGKVPMSGKVKHFTVTNPGSIQNRTVRNNNGGSAGDGKYPYQFPLYYDNNSQRRLSFETFLYAEDVTSTYPPPQFSGYAQTIRTGVVLNEYYEYYSRGSGRWYRAGEERTTSFNLYISGHVSGPNFSPEGMFPGTVGPLGARSDDYGPSYSPDSGSGVGFIQATNIPHTGGDYQQGIAVAKMYNYRGYVEPRQANLVWDYEVYGQYSAYVTSDKDHTHTEGTNYLPLW